MYVSNLYRDTSSSVPESCSPRVFRVRYPGADSAVTARSPSACKLPAVGLQEVQE